ncbi:MAG: 3-dehydroquinate synthase [Vicinamibacterales bacterium]
MAVIRLEITHASGAYPVLIGAGLTRQLGSIFAEQQLIANTVVITCPPVWRLHGERLSGVLGGQAPLVMPDGEKAKHLATVARLYDGLVERRTDRAALVVGFGGGVVGDTAGFAAATYLRGVRFAQVPTTLLAQVDSAIGGKVGVNLTAGKNLVGAFHAPSVVVCDPEVLGTLPRREFRAGLYEAVKYGVIASRELFDRIATQLPDVFKKDPAILTALIAECCRIKAAVVMIDERERGPRRALNFGHTVGHALEAVSRYGRFLHGEAVGYGMLAAAALSHRRGVLPSADLKALQDIIGRMGPLPSTADLKATEVLDAILKDKKVSRGTLHFVLPVCLGTTTVVSDVTHKELKAALRTIGIR